MYMYSSGVLFIFFFTQHSYLWCNVLSRPSAVSQICDGVIFHVTQVDQLLLVLWKVVLFSRSWR